MKKTILVLLIELIFIQIILSNVQGIQPKYGVFTGLDSSKMNKLNSYNEVVIDASNYSKSQITLLHKNGIKVYSYLNIGSLENFRSYYNNFVNITLGNYNNWPGEKWIDISNSKWRDFIVNNLAKSLKEKGVDGFFLDNLDIYEEYPNNSIFNGILNIITRLDATYKLPIIANGGYNFFTKAINNKLILKNLVYGVNTESVYTDINFKNNTFILNSPKNRQYAIDYLNKLKALGLNIYIVEYSKNTTINKDIANFYNKLNFKYYISNNLSLN